MLRLVVVLILASASACGGSSTATRAEAGPPVDLPQTTGPLDGLVSDLVAGQLCGELRGRFRSLRAPGKGKPPVIGRLWLRDCHAVAGHDAIRLTVDALGWRWIDKESEAAGATFAVKEYARFAVRLEATVRVRAAYDADAHLGYLWLAPRGPVTAAVKAARVEVETPGKWSTAIGWVSDALPMVSIDEEATSKVADKASDTFVEKVGAGFSLVADLCTGEKDKASGMVSPAQWASRNWRDSSKPKRLADYEIIVHPGGLDVSGPFEIDERGVVADVEVTTGGAAIVTLTCREEAEKVVTAFVAGQPLPVVEHKAEVTVQPGQKARIQAPPRCTLVALTRPAGDAPVMLKLRVRRKVGPDPIPRDCVRPR